MHFLRLLAVCWTGAQSARDNHLLACNLPNSLRIKKESFTDRLSNKHFSIWLSTTPPHLKHVAILPCNYFIVSRLFYDINVSQGSVATYARSGGIYNNQIAVNLPRNLPVKRSWKSVKIWQNYSRVCGVTFLAHPVDQGSSRSTGHLAGRVQSRGCAWWPPRRRPASPVPACECGWSKDSPSPAYDQSRILKNLSRAIITRWQAAAPLHARTSF